MEGKPFLLRYWYPGHVSITLEDTAEQGSSFPSHSALPRAEYSEQGFLVRISTGNPLNSPFSRR